MNLYLATVEILRRVTGRYALAPTIEKPTYVYILVPFDFYGNGDAKRAAVVEPLIEHRQAVEQSEPVPMPVDSLAVDDGSGEADEPKLNYDLAWTLFLPNPLWPPKKPK
jgi:hypothetical protein